MMAAEENELIFGSIAFLALLAIMCANGNAASIGDSVVYVAGFNYQVVMKGTGSGFCFAPGYVLTAGHCSNMGSVTRVRDADGTWHNATVYSKGSPDWAILKVPTLDVPTLRLDRDGVREGEPVYAYGRFKEGIRNNGGYVQRWVFQGRYQFATTKVYPGYSGARPRVQIWHGTADDTLRYPNFGETIDQWTNVHGLSTTPTSTDSPQSGWTRTRYGDKVEAISMQGTGHNLMGAGMALRAIQFFGLDKPGDTTTTTTSTTTSTTTTTTTTTTTPPPGGCKVTYGVNSWNTGLTASITIANTSTSAINGWQLAFTLPGGQAITSGWNATYSPTSGAITARNASYNGALAAGASVGIGFQATHSGNTDKPTSFTLNGVACTIG